MTEPVPDNQHTKAQTQTMKACSFWERVQAAEVKEGILGRSKERRGGAPIGARYPLKLPCRYTEDGVEICRFHNYSQAGCIRGAQGRCLLDHSVCHWCGDRGHIALACEVSTPCSMYGIGAYTFYICVSHICIWSRQKSRWTSKTSRMS